MGNNVSSSSDSDHADGAPRCFVSNGFTDESSEEEVEWNPCCKDKGSRVNIEDIVVSTGGIFATREIQEVMKAVRRDHFTYNTGVKISSIYYNIGEEPGPDNDFHVCFAPRLELPVHAEYREFFSSLQLKRGQYFLHLGSGTGYINTVVGLMIGATGVNHGVELNPEMIAYAEERQQAFRDHCDALQLFDYCEPIFILGDCLKLEGNISCYDRIFCSGELPIGYQNLLKLYLKNNGILVYPKDDITLGIIEKVTDEKYIERGQTDVSMHFYSFVSHANTIPTLLPECILPSLQQLTRKCIRDRLRLVQLEHSTRRKRVIHMSSSDSDHENKRVRTTNEVDIPTQKNNHTDFGEPMPNNFVEVTSQVQKNVSNVQESINVFPETQNNVEEIVNKVQEITVKLSPEICETSHVQITDQGNNTVNITTQIQERNSMVDSVEIQRNFRINVDLLNVIPPVTYFDQNKLEEQSDASTSSDRKETIVIDTDSSYFDQNKLEEQSDAGTRSVQNETIFFDIDSSTDDEQERVSRNPKISRFYDSSDESLYSSDSNLTEDDDYCDTCEMTISRNIPQKLKPFNPDLAYPFNDLNSRINMLPLPKYLIYYLKYKHNLVN